jgi:hypothetical protein
MRQLHTLALAVLAGLSGLGCATAPTGAALDPAQPVADSSCRNVTSLTGKVQPLCGTAAEWAEFDSRMAQLDQGFSCKPVKGSQPLCLFARQWEHVNRRKALLSGPLPNGFGDEAQRSAMAIEHNEYAAARQDLIDSAAGRPLPIP